MDHSRNTESRRLGGQFFESSWGKPPKNAEATAAICPVDNRKMGDIYSIYIHTFCKDEELRRTFSETKAFCPKESF